MHSVHTFWEKKIIAKMHESQRHAASKMCFYHAPKFAVAHESPCYARFLNFIFSNSEHFRAFPARFFILLFLSDYVGFGKTSRLSGDLPRPPARRLAKVVARKNNSPFPQPATQKNGKKCDTRNRENNEKLRIFFEKFGKVCEAERKKSQTRKSKKRQSPGEFPRKFPRNHGGGKNG